LEVKRDILWRVYLSFIGIVLVGFMIIGRAFYIQQFEGTYWRNKSDSLHQQFIDLAAERGTIYSEDGSMLSTSVPYFDIYIDFAADGLKAKKGKLFYTRLDSLAVALSVLFKDQSTAAYRKQLLDGYKKKDRYYALKKHLSFEQYKALRSFSLINQGRNKSGFIVEVNSKRLNPFGLLANRTIGLARKNAQNVGLERTYDSLLKGESGSKLVRYIAGGVSVPVEGYEVEPENGKDIITTIDVNIQDITENALLRMMTGNECTNGTAVVMEVATGKVKAIANLGRREDGAYWEDLNYAIRASEPGSTFKLATLLAVLEDKHVTLNQHVNLEGGKWNINKRTVYDSETHGLHEVTVQEAFEHSSNVGMAKLVTSFYLRNPGQYIDHLKKLHFDRHSGIGLIGETNPIIKTPRSKTWSATTLPWMSFGYEVLISPMQTLMLYNAVANNGIMMKPYLVNAIQKDGLNIVENEPAVLEESICSEETLQQLKKCLEGVMTNGTGRSLQDSFYRIAGKTGTALVANGKRGYADHIYQSSFAGYFPADNPQYSCIVVIKNRPNAKKFYGAMVAGPVFKEIADKLNALNIEKTQVIRVNEVRADSIGYYYTGNTKDIRHVLNMLDLPYIDSASAGSWSSMYANNNRLVLHSRPVGKNAVPNVKGMGLKDALYLLEKMNVKVITKGKGKVVSQSIEPGTLLAGSKTVSIELNP